MDFLRNFIGLLLWALQLAIIGRAVISWFDPTFRNPISRLLRDVTEPILAPIRAIIPSAGGMIDLSPMVAIIIIWILQQLINSALASMY